MFKRVLLLPLFFLFILSGFAQNRHNNGAALNIFSDQEPFFLYINDVLYNESPRTRIRVEGLTNFKYDIRIEFDSRQRSVASAPRLSMYNELNQPLDVTFLARTDRRIGNSLILFSLFPINVYAPDIESFALYSYGKPKRPLFDQNDFFGDDLMTDKEFADFMNSLKRESFDKDKLDVARLVVHNFSFSIKQIREAMKLFSWDDEKVAFAELMYDNCIDKANYFTLLDLLTFSNAKDKLTTFIKNRSAEDRYISQMNSAEFQNFLKQIGNAPFDGDKTKLLSTVSGSVSFSVSDIRSILKKYSFDEGKLNAAKMLYPNCSNKQNYYTLLDEFSFSSSKKELQDFLSAKR